MSVTDRIRVEVLGSSYFITTTESEEYIRELEKKFNQEISTLLEMRPNIAFNDALVLIGLNIMDAYQKAENGAEHMRKQLSEYLSDAAKARTAVEDAHREIERLNKELAIYRRAAAAEGRNV